jgi:hypothetical protein
LIVDAPAVLLASGLDAEKKSKPSQLVVAMCMQTLQTGAPMAMMEKKETVRWE